MKSKENKSQYVVFFRLKTNKYQETILNERFDLLTEMYDDIQRYLLRKYHYIRNLKVYKNFIAEETQKGHGRYANAKFFKDYKDSNGFSFTKVGITKLSPKFTKTPKYKQKGFNAKIIGDVLANVWMAWEKKLKDDNVKIKLKSHTNTSVNSYTVNATNDTKTNRHSFLGMMNLNDVKTKNVIHIKTNDGLTNKAKYIDIPFKVKTYYEMFAFGQDKTPSNISNVTIKRELIYGKWVFFVGFTIEGIPYNKGRKIGKGNVGIDLGTNTVAIYGVSDNFLYKSNTNEIAKVDSAKVTKLQQELDRITRINNPLRFNEDGTAKSFRGYKKADIPQWVISNKMLMLKSEIQNEQRKAARKRKIAHFKLANMIIEHGDNIKVENNPISKWAMNDKCETTINENTGKCNSKRGFGKSVGNFAPSMLMTIIENKVKDIGGQFKKIDIKNAATQFDHTNLEYTKHNLDERKVTLSDGNTFDRDAHAAFNISFNDGEIVHKGKKEDYTKNYNIKEMNIHYNLFKKAHKEYFKY